MKGRKPATLTGKRALGGTRKKNKPGDPLEMNTVPERSGRILVIGGVRGLEMKMVIERKARGIIEAITVVLGKIMKIMDIMQRRIMALEVITAMIHKKWAPKMVSIQEMNGDPTTAIIRAQTTVTVPALTTATIPAPATVMTREMNGAPKGAMAMNQRKAMALIQEMNGAPTTAIIRGQTTVTVPAQTTATIPAQATVMIQEMNGAPRGAMAMNQRKTMDMI